MLEAPAVGRGIDLYGLCPTFGGECEVLWSDGQDRIRSRVASEEQGCQSTKHEGEEAFHNRVIFRYIHQKLHIFNRKCKSR